jgi:hypothetical protein
MPIAVWVVIGIIAILLIIFIVNYNGLVGLRNRVRNAWAQIDVQLKRRHDLIPNLVETVKGYKDYERSTLEAVTNARNLAQAGVSASPAERAKLEGALGGALSRLLPIEFVSLELWVGHLWQTMNWLTSRQRVGVSFHLQPRRVQHQYERPQTISG